MRIRAAMVLTVVITASALILGGCGESKAAKEARLKGIEQVKNEDYASAVESFDLALKEADGVVNAFELDILKYRGEAEFMLEDYEAAAHTYGILADVDGKEPAVIMTEPSGFAARRLRAAYPGRKYIIRWDSA